MTNKIFARILFLLAVCSFVIAESVLVALEFKGFQFSAFLYPVVNIYTLCLVIAVPFGAGLKGYLFINTKSQEKNDLSNNPALSYYFLLGIIGSYSAFIFLIEALIH